MDALTMDMVAVLVILAGAIALFVTDFLRIDVTALLVMVIIGVTGLIEAEQVLAGFSSNAVVSIIAIMIMGAGLDRAGSIRRLAEVLIQVAGESERRVSAVLSTAASLVSAFVQNIGTAALFLPVTERISQATGIDSSRLLIPMGFAATLGGTATMVGTGPMILLNDLLGATATNLGVEIQVFPLFAPAPIGLALLASGLILFALFGNQLLPATGERRELRRTLADVARSYGFDQPVQAFLVSSPSPLQGQTVELIETGDYGVAIVAVWDTTGLSVVPHRDFVVQAGSILGVVGAKEDVDFFVADRFLDPVEGDPFALLRDEEVVGIAELLVRRGGDAVGKTVRQLRMRSTYGVSLLAIHRRGQLVIETVREARLEPGDILVVFGLWEQMERLAREPAFVAISHIPAEPPRLDKEWWALGGFALSMGLVLFTELQLSVALMVGAVLFLITRVLTPDEAYRAVSWQTVFLLAALIPLGTAVEKTGTAAWIADSIIAATAGLPVWGIQLVIALLTTAFTLTISNVGAVVLLVPLAANVAVGVGASPGQFGMVVALAASNGFLLPTQQVNALIMNPGGYSVGDYLKAGSAMSLVFLVVMILGVNLFM